MPNVHVHVERDPQTGILVGSIPGWPGAYTQAETLEELVENLREVVAMLLEDDSDPQAQELRAEAQRLGVRPEELLTAAGADLLDDRDDDFESASASVLEKNRELYRRLS